MKIFMLAAVGLVAAGAAYATHAKSQDANLAQARRPLSQVQVQALVRAEVDAVGTRPMAVAVIPGPLNAFDIDLHVVNLREARITESILDVFRTKNRRSLLIESCWDMTPDVTPLYPALTFGRGPMVLGFDDFRLAQVRSVGMDPDTYPNSSYGATVRELHGSQLQVVFEDGARGVGVLTVTDNDNVAAFVYPTYVPGPAPRDVLLR